MAVYKRQYRPYAGPWTDARTRFWVVPRYALAELLHSRTVVSLLCVVLVPLLLEIAAVYLSHNAAARALLGIVKLDALLKIDSTFFRQVLSTHCFFGFILAAWVGPTLIAPDLVDGALPLYLSRPHSRVDYVLGKAITLLLSTSIITWIPGLLLYVLNAILAGDGWWLSHFYVATAFIVGGLAWSLVVTLLALSISAWLKWRLAASALLFGFYFVSSGVGEALALALRSPWGRIGHIGYLFDLIWGALLRLPHPKQEVPLLASSLVLVTLCLLCWLTLERRLRAREEVK